MKQVRGGDGAGRAGAVPRDAPPRGGCGGGDRSAVACRQRVSGSMARCCPHQPGAPGGMSSAFAMAARVFGLPMFLPVSICPRQAGLIPAAFASCFRLMPRLNRRVLIGLLPRGGWSAAAASAGRWPGVPAAGPGQSRGAASTVNCAAVREASIFHKSIATTNQPRARSPERFSRPTAARCSPWNRVPSQTTTSASSPSA